MLRSPVPGIFVIENEIDGVTVAGGQTGRPTSGLALDGPRERLRTVGAAALSDEEILSLLLRTGASGTDVKQVACMLLTRFGGLAAAVNADETELCSVRGMGAAKSASLLAASELARRVGTRRLEIGAKMGGAADVHRHFFERLRDCRSERFHALLLDGRHRVLSEVLVSQGTLTASLVHPREVFRQAVRQAAAAMVLVHNHPSGDPAPSAEDHRVTERLCRAGEVLGIRVLDHVVVAEHGYHSFHEAGDL